MAEEKKVEEVENKEEINLNDDQHVENEEQVQPSNEQQHEENEQENASENKINELEEKIAELEAKLEEKENRYLRLQADFDNSRRRAKLDFEAAQKYRSQSLIEDILPVLDNFERALKVETDNDEVKSVLEGMNMIYRSLLEALKKEGLEQIEAEGKEFDPNFHQAVMQVQEEGFDSNVVVEEFQKGYLLKDRVIRPSMVKVNQ